MTLKRDMPIAAIRSKKTFFSTEITKIYHTFKSNHTKIGALCVTPNIWGPPPKQGSVNLLPPTGSKRAREGSVDPGWGVQPG